MWIINRIYFAFSHLKLLFLSHLSRDSMVSVSKAFFSLISTTLSHLTKTHNDDGPRRANPRLMKGGNETHDCEGEQKGLWRNHLKTPPPKSHYNNAKTPKQRKGLPCLCMVKDLRWLGFEIQDWQKSQTHKKIPIAHPQTSTSQPTITTTKLYQNPEKL